MLDCYLLLSIKFNTIIEIIFRNIFGRTVNDSWTLPQILGVQMCETEIYGS